MAKVRYTGAAPAEVRLNGHPRGGVYTVEPDQVIEVDDDVYKAHVWPETRWTEVEAAGKARKSADKSKGGE